MMGRLGLVLFGLLLMEGVSFAHEGHAHGEAQMAKLHKMMPRYAQAEDAIKAALEKGDVATVDQETSYLLSTVPDLKRSKPHQRLKALKDFKKIAASFETDVRLTKELARKGDLAGAERSFADAEKRCSACHAEFRD